MRKSTIYLFILGIAVLVTAAIASAGFVASAQNSNSSTTMTNTNTAKPKPRHRRPKKPATTTGDASMTPQKTGKCDPTQQEQTDLSGTYTGKMKHGKDPVQDATLTITGNSFSGTMGGQTVSGRIVAVTTCGYTAVTIMHEGQPHAMSLRAKKMGDNLTLTSVPGEPEQIMFTTGGSMMKPKPHKHRAKPKAKTGTATTAPAKTTP